MNNLPDIMILLVELRLASCEKHDPLTLGRADTRLTPELAKRAADAIEELRALIPSNENHLLKRESLVALAIRR